MIHIHIHIPKYIFYTFCLHKVIKIRANKTVSASDHDSAPWRTCGGNEAQGLSVQLLLLNYMIANGMHPQRGVGNTRRNSSTLSRRLIHKTYRI